MTLNFSLGLCLPSAGIKDACHHLPACLDCILEYEVSIWAEAVGEGIELKGIESARLDPWLEGKGIEVLTYRCVGWLPPKSLQERTKWAGRGGSLS